MEAVVEFHGFKDNENRFLVKELAIVSKCSQTLIVFDAPYSKSRLNGKMLRTAHWLTQHFHKIKWEQVGVPYDEELIYTLCKPFSVIHTKGLEKVKFLEEFHPKVREIFVNNEDCTKVQVECILPQHNNCSTACALQTARIFYNYIINGGKNLNKK